MTEREVATKQTRRYELAMILNPPPRNHSIKPTLWQLMSRREKIREVCALMIVAAVLAVVIFGAIVLETQRGLAWWVG